jgi:hypothetical protein
MAINIPIITDFNGKGIDLANSAIGGFGGSATKVFKNVAKFAAIGGAAIAAGLGASVKAAAEDAQGQAVLAKTLKNSSNSTDDQISSIEDLISSMTLATGVADDDLRNGLGTLVRATGNSTKAFDLLKSAMDISAATGKPLEATTSALAKGYLGQMGALKKLGVPLDASIIKSKDFAAAMDAVNENFGGSQEALSNSAVGRFDRLKNAFGEASETLGTALLPAFEKIVGFATTTLIPAFETVSKVFDEKGLGGVLKLLGDKLKEGIPIALEALKNLLTKMGNWIVNDGLPLLGEKLSLLKDKLTAWIKESGPEALTALGAFIGDMIKWIVNDGIPLLIKATAKLSVALLKWLIDIGPDLIKGLAGFAAELAKSLIEAVIGALSDLGKFGLEIGKAFANGILSVINTQIIDRINKLLEFTIDPPGPGPTFKINAPDIPRIPMLADGGIVTGPTLAMIGEAGPEAVIPLSGRNMPNMGNNITINVNGGDPNSVVAALRSYMRQNGSIPIRTSNIF